MNTEKLRSLIRESINEYIREVEYSGNVAAQEAKINACEEAIALREKKINMEGLDEAYHDMVSEEKIKEIKGEIKALENYKKKAIKMLEKMKAKKEGKKEVVADAQVEEAPVDEADVTAEMDMKDEGMKDEALNESFLKMQKLAGVITEAQYNTKRKALVENQINEAEKSIQAFGPRLMDGLKKDGFDAKFTTNDSEQRKLQDIVKNSDKKLAVVYYDAPVKYIAITTNKDNQDAAFKVVDSGFVKELLPDDYTFSKQGAFFIEIQGK